MLQEMEQVEKEEHLSETDLKARQTCKSLCPDKTVHVL